MRTKITKGNTLWRGSWIAIGALALALPSATPFMAKAAWAADDDPIEIRQKWVAGQQLSYDTAMTGTVNMQLSPSMPIPIAGIPLEVAIQGTSETMLDTLKVDDGGSATVAIRVPRMQFKADTFGQRLEFNVADGKMAATMNGQPMGAARPADPLVNPPVALKISDHLKLQELVPLKTTTPPAAGAAAPAGQAADPMAKMWDWNRIYQSAFMQVLPALMPDKAVKVGDTWTSTVLWPEKANAAAPAAAPDAAGATAPPTLGQFDFTLAGLEDIGGKKVQHIAVKGAFKITEQQAALINQQVANQAEPNANGRGNANQVLTGVAQSIQGDLWFDADAGHLVRAELNVSSQAFGRDRPVAGKPAPKPNAADSWLDFSGTVQMQLKKVSDAAAPAAM